MPTSRQSAVSIMASKTNPEATLKILEKWADFLGYEDEQDMREKRFESLHVASSLVSFRPKRREPPASKRKMSTAYAAAYPYWLSRVNAQRYASLTRMSVVPSGSPPETR